MLESLESLDGLVGRSRTGAAVGVEMRRWIDTYTGLAESPTLSAKNRDRISQMILELSSRLGDDAPREARELTAPSKPPFADAAESHPAPRRIVLRKPAERTPDMAGQFLNTLREAESFLVGNFAESEHILTRLESILSKAAIGRNANLLHLAGSIIYYLKIHGYKMDPYVQRLKEAENATLPTSKNVGENGN